MKPSGYLHTCVTKAVKYKMVIVFCDPGEITPAPWD